MGTSRVTIRITAKRKTGNTKGTVSTVNKTNIVAPKVSDSKKRIVIKKGPNVNYVKDS